MKILNYSDTHFNTIAQVDNFFKYVPDSSLYDIVTLAGDITNGNFNTLKYFISRFEKPCYIVFGNHDYYNSSIEAVYAFAEEQGINYLKSGKSYKITVDDEEYTLIGGTGWTGFNLYKDNTKKFYKSVAANSINDFRLINYKNKLVTPSQYQAMHKEEWQWFLNFKNIKNTILLTHFPMSKVCLDPAFEVPSYRNCNPYFINEKDTTGFNLAISGHTHTCVDAIDDYGCRHYINAFGYPYEFGRSVSDSLKGSNGFDSHKIIEY